MVLLCYRHGLRVSELVDMQWSQVDFNQSRLHVNRAKTGNDGVHPVKGDELRSLRKLQRDYPGSTYLFVSERKAPLSVYGARKIFERAGVEAGFAFKIHPHMLRHACGYYLANKGRDTRTIQDYLGHKSISTTVRYTQLSSSRFEGLWN